MVVNINLGMTFSLTKIQSGSLDSYDVMIRVVVDSVMS